MNRSHETPSKLYAPGDIFFFRYYADEYGLTRSGIIIEPVSDGMSLVTDFTGQYDETYLVLVDDRQTYLKITVNSMYTRSIVPIMYDCDHTGRVDKIRQLTIIPKRIAWKDSPT
jgi:hypothetical protein